MSRPYASSEADLLITSALGDQALTPTPIIDSLLLNHLTGPQSSSLIIAKPDRIEIWDVTSTGLTKVTDFQVWGSVLGLSKAIIPVNHFDERLRPPHPMTADVVTFRELDLTSSSYLLHQMRVFSYSLPHHC